MAAKQDTEQVILESARKVFVELGPANARMQDVAEEAGITPSLLHYYYRKRDDLYRAVFEREVKRFIPKQLEVLATDKPLVPKLSEFARGVIAFHAENPHLAAFVAFETHYNAEHQARISDAFDGLDLDRLQAQIDREADAGRIRRIDARHLITHTLSMCLMPFVGRPVLQSAMEMDDDAFDRFLEARKETVPHFIEAALVREEKG